MLSKRLTESRPVVSLSDEALLDIDIDVVRKYGLTRDYEIIRDRTLGKATIFHVIPLMPKWEHLQDQAMLSNSQATWSIFRTHVKKIDNFPHEIRFEESGELKIHDDVRALIPVDVVAEIALVILQLARESSQGFTIADSWQVQRARSLALRALNAPIETAKITSTQ